MDEVKNRRLLKFSIYSHLEPNQRVFNSDTVFLEELFYRLLKKYNFQSPYNYIPFSFGKEASEMIGENVYRKTFNIDLTEFHKIDISERKWMIFDIVYKALTLITPHKSSLESLTKVYDECSKQGLRNEWYLKDKYYRSPDRSKYIGIWCVWNEDLEVYIHLFDKDKQTLIQNEFCIKIPSHYGESIYRYKPKWKDSECFYLDYRADGVVDGSKRIGNIEILI